MSVCLRLVPGCAECDLEGEFLAGRGHSCGESELRRTVSWCSVLGRSRRESGRFHRQSHAPKLCGRCGALINDQRGVERLAVVPCSRGLCSQWRCPDCDFLLGSVGPVDVCRSCDPWVRERFRRMHVGYRRRRS